MTPKEEIKNLKAKYELICNRYITIFCKKQGYEFSGWIADDIGGVAGFIEQYFFCFNDIFFDVNNNCKKGLIFEWQDYCLGLNGTSINYYSYSKGARL